MKLNSKELQALDLLLISIQNFRIWRNSNQIKPTYSESDLKIIFSYNGRFFTGNFLESKEFKSYTLNSSGFLEHSYINLDDIFDSNELNNIIRTYSLTDDDKLYFLQSALCEFVKKSDLSNLKLNPYCYNVKELNSDFSIPYIYLDPDKEYDVVSISATKD
ncbi:hypothetical protein [Clostridium baratii]|uniref:hypothetical protein n=1 Tax=Clostridium baratii TaxID=1561 RepID=UPI0030D357ED